MPSFRDLVSEEKTTIGSETSTAHDDSHGPFKSEMIRAQVVRILTSPEFEKSVQLGRFLDYVVEETLAGRGDQIKQYTVAVKALGRPSGFDPRADPIVRIEARRLRRSLARYYQLYGVADPIIIEIPIGAYVPAFRKNERAKASAETSPPGSRSGQSNAAIPTLLLAPFEARLNDEGQRFFADTLGEELAIVLHRFQHLHVVGPISRENSSNLLTTAQQYQADFTFQGRVIKSGDKIKITVRLWDALTGRQLWSETYISQDQDDLIEFSEDVVHRIAATLLDTYGVISRIFLRRASQWSDQSFRIYQAILQHSRYLIGDMGHGADAAIKALEEAIKIAPHNAQIKAMLADIYFMLYQYGGDSSLLSSGESLANAALRLDPRCQIAYFVIAFSAYFHGHRELFMRQMREAVQLNPYNPYVMATAGIHLGIVGEWEEGFALIARAMKLNPNFPGWYHSLAFLDLYRHGRFEEALVLAKRFNSPTFFWDPLIRAATLGQLGRKEEAEKALQELLELQPDFLANERELMTRTLFMDDLVEMLLEGLYKAGLDKVA